MFFLMFSGVCGHSWSVDAAVVCCCWLLKFITHIYAAAALEASQSTLWYYAAQRLIYESSVPWKPLSCCFSGEWPRSPTRIQSGKKLLQRGSVMGLFLLRSTRLEKQRGKTFVSLFSISMLTGEVFSCFLLAGSHLQTTRSKECGLPLFN